MYLCELLWGRGAATGAVCECECEQIPQTSIMLWMMIMQPLARRSLIAFHYISRTRVYLVRTVTMEAHIASDAASMCLLHLLVDRMLQC
jgi:hypothetical protein